MSIGRGKPKEGAVGGGTSDRAEMESSVDTGSSQPFPERVSDLCRPRNSLGFSRILDKGPLKLLVQRKMEAC